MKGQLYFGSHREEGGLYYVAEDEAVFKLSSPTWKKPGAREVKELPEDAKLEPVVGYQTDAALMAAVEKIDANH